MQLSGSSAIFTVDETVSTGAALTWQQQSRYGFGVCRLAEYMGVDMKKGFFRGPISRFARVFLNFYGSMHERIQRRGYFYGISRSKPSQHVLQIIVEVLVVCPANGFMQTL